MGTRPLTERGKRHLASLPPVLRASYDYQAIVHVLAKEMDRLEGCLEQVRAQFNPQTADVLLSAWETTFKLPVGGGGATLEQRQNRVVLRVRKLLGASEGREWEQDITDLVGQGWTYEEHVPGDPLSPPADTIRITFPFTASAPIYAEALREIREITPAHLELEFVSGTGFLHDVSEQDVEGLHF